MGILMGNERSQGAADKIDPDALVQISAWKGRSMCAVEGFLWQIHGGMSG